MSKELDDYDLGCLYFYGDERRKPNYRKAFPLLLSEAKAGVRHAQNLVGFCYDSGRGVRRDHRAAVAWWAKAARQGHVIATTNLAMCYEFGTGVATSLRRAIQLYQKAAEAGDTYAQCNLAVLLLESKDGNAGKAVEWLRKSAGKGEAKSQYNLGMCYVRGEGVRASRRYASLWLRKAAGQGHRKAIGELTKLLARNATSPIKRTR